MNGISRTADCLLASGNWFIDTFHLQCGIATEWKVAYWIAVFAVAILLARKNQHYWKRGLLVILAGLLVWLGLRIIIAFLFVKVGLYTNNDFWDSLRYIFTNNPF